MAAGCCDLIWCSRPADTRGVTLPYDRAVSFSGAGLALDVVGAFLVSLGLYRHPVPLFLGWGRTPHAAASDRAFGTSGTLFFLLGFGGQLMSSAGYGSHRRAAVIWSAAVALSAGTAAAYVLFGAFYVA